MTWEQFLLRAEGYFEKITRDWEHTRLVAYTIYATTVEKKEEIYDWLPLPTDPTKKHREQMRKKQQRKEEVEAKKLVDFYKKMNFI